MAEEKKKNPLLGAFRSPEPPKTPPPGPKPPATGPVVPDKPDGEKKPNEPPKVPADGKTPAAGLVVPDRPGEEKKPAELPKVPADGKTPSTGPVVPDKPGEEKKPTDPPKVPADVKAPAAGKPGEEKKPTNPPKVPADGKPPIPAEDTELPKDLKIPLTPEGQPENVTTLSVADIHQFDGHPFNVNDDKDMWDLVDSIKKFGVLEPAVVIPRKEGGYEMVSGHRRHRACQLAGLTAMPVIVRNLDRDSAIISMVDANLKRENISPMEKARAYSMKLDAMKRKAGRRSKTEILTGEKPRQAVEELAKQTGESASVIKRYRNLTNLTPELQTLVDKKELPVVTASEISFLKEEEQKVLADTIEKEGGKVPSVTQAAALKEASKKGTLTTETIAKTVAPTKREENPPLKVTFGEDELRSYFPDKHTTVGDVKRTVFEALDLRAKALERQAKKEAAKENPLARKPAEKQR